MHMPDARVSKSMHPAAKMCTQGAGCTLNFEHWLSILLYWRGAVLRDLDTGCAYRGQYARNALNQWRCVRRQE